MMGGRQHDDVGARAFGTHAIGEGDRNPAQGWRRATCKV